MVTNKQFNKNCTESVNMGFSDHLAQILQVYIDERNKERKFSKENIVKFIVMLNNELWKEIFLGKNVDELYQIFINTFLYYFTRVFPLKLVKKRDKRNNLYGYLEE
jgi:hypothetical protein